MKIIVFIERENKTRTINFSKKTVKELLDQLKINLETVIIVRKEEIITEEEVLNDKDKIELLNVVSGG